MYDEWVLKSASGAHKDYLESYNRIKCHYKKSGSDKIVFLRKSIPSTLTSRKSLK
jgi:hypothetical protein